MCDQCLITLACVLVAMLPSRGMRNVGAGVGETGRVPGTLAGGRLCDMTKA
jgi:hypothetical protein